MNIRIVIGSVLVPWACFALLGCAGSEDWPPPDTTARDQTALPVATRRAVLPSSRGGETSVVRALLVGCTTYPSLNQLRHLQGPANDVVLVRDLLIDRFGVDPRRIKTLADAEGEENWPTRANIVREFERLIGEVQSGEYVFILLAGHGSQQPDLDPDSPADVEWDGLDEVFLPRDIGHWSSAQKTVENAIVDDELRDWLSAIVSKGSFVFVAIDTCHSGSATRGLDGVPRNVPPDELGVPVVDVPAVSGPVAPGSAAVAPRDWYDAAEATGGSSGLVALYASQSHEEAIEDRFPDGRKYGRLSFALCEILQTSPEPISYSELARKIHWRFTQEGWLNRSTPWMEGTDLSREVLGARVWPGRSQLTLIRSGEGHVVSGGLLHRVTEGSVLSVHPPAGELELESLLGYVIVTEAGPLESRVAPVAFDGVPATDEFPELARCRVVYRELGEMTLSLAAVAEGFDDPAAETSLLVGVDDVLRDMAEDSDALIRLAEDKDRADWYAVVRPDGLLLQRSSSSRSVFDTPESLDTARRFGEVFGPERIEQAAWWLPPRLHQLTRAANLRKLAGQEDGAWDPRIDLQLTVTRDGEEFLPDLAATAAVRDGDNIYLHIKNTGRNAVSLAVFYIQNDSAIITFFPRTREHYRNLVLDRGGELKPIQFRINDKTLGWEDVIVIAVDAAHTETIREIHLLAEENMDSRSRSGRLAPPEPFKTPLGRFLDNAMNGGRKSRGVDEPVAADFGSYTIRRLTWNVLPSELSPQ